MPQTLKVNFEKQLVCDENNIGRQYVFMCKNSIVKISDILNKLEQFKATLDDDSRLALSDLFHIVTKGKTFSNEKQVKNHFLNGFFLGKFASNTDLSVIGTEVRIIHSPKKTYDSFENFDNSDGEENVSI